MTIKEKQEEVMAELSLFDDWMDKYSYIIELGKELPPLDKKYQSEAYTVKGCQSKVQLGAELIDGRLHYFAEADAIIPKGIIALLLKIFSGHTPKEIINADWDFIKNIGLNEHLSPTRAGGLDAMIKQMKLYALTYA